ETGPSGSTTCCCWRNTTIKPRPPRRSGRCPSRGRFHSWQWRDQHYCGGCAAAPDVTQRLRAERDSESLGGFEEDAERFCPAVLAVGLDLHVADLEHRLEDFGAEVGAIDEK